MAAPANPGAVDAIVSKAMRIFVERKNARLNINEVAIGSISKQFLASEVVLLQSHGQIQVSDKLARYFPAFAQAQNISIADLLSHEAGVRDYYPLDYNTLVSRHPTTMQAIVARASHEPLDFGSLWDLYSRNFFRPLGMTSSGWGDGSNAAPSGINGSRFTLSRALLCAWILTRLRFHIGTRRPSLAI
jgi:CubicO group peptidase (beta-lactamase class C family)